jgi:hypothetical protein
MGVGKEGFDFEPPPISSLSFRQGLGAGHPKNMSVSKNYCHPFN